MKAFSFLNFYSAFSLALLLSSLFPFCSIPNEQKIILENCMKNQFGNDQNTITSSSHYKDLFTHNVESSAYTFLLLRESFLWHLILKPQKSLAENYVDLELFLLRGIKFYNPFPGAPKTKRCCDIVSSVVPFCQSCADWTGPSGYWAKPDDSLYCSSWIWILLYRQQISQNRVFRRQPQLFLLRGSIIIPIKQCRRILQWLLLFTVTHW